MTGRQPLVLEHPCWQDLLAALACHAKYRFLGEIPERLAQGILAAPLAVARWISECAPALSQRHAMRILVVGAERMDAVDEGRWYQLLPVLLNAPVEVEVALVGDALNERFQSPLHAYAPPRAAHFHRSALAQFVATDRVAHYDVAMMFHPGLQKHRAWLQDGSLARLLEAEVALVASSFGIDEFEVERWVLECYGFAVAGAPLDNPFRVDIGERHAAVHWGRALWRWSDRRPGPADRPDTARLEQLEQLSRMVLDSMARSEHAPAGYGAPLELRSSKGDVLRFVHVFDGCLVAAEGGLVYQLREGSLQPLAGATIPGEEAAAFARAGSDLERALVAARLKARYLLPAFPPLPASAQPSRLAADMHTAMRARIDRLFAPDV